MTVQAQDPATTPEPEPGLVRPRGAEGGGDAVTLPREDLHAFVHDLRNHLNSLLMNAGVVAAHCREKEKVERYVRQVELDGEKCADALRRLSDRYL